MATVLLTDVLETSGIAIEADGTVVCDREEVKSWITPDVHVSMNMWAAYPEFLDKLESGFAEFLKDESGDPLKKEYLIPIIVDGLLKQNKATVKVLETLRAVHRYSDFLFFRCIHDPTHGLRHGIKEADRFLIQLDYARFQP